MRRGAEPIRNHLGSGQLRLETALISPTGLVL